MLNNIFLYKFNYLEAFFVQRKIATWTSGHEAPQVRFPSGLDSNNPKCVVSILGCTGDWFGGWDGLDPGDVNKFITADLQGGRMVDVIESSEPAVMVCHWPGIYFNGEKLGFNILKEIKQRLDQKYNHLIWMKLSEISRYWAAKELTTITVDDKMIILNAPFAAPDFTLKINSSVKNTMVKNSDPLQKENKISEL